MVLALALINAAYLSQSVQAGIAAIGPGQWAAGLSLGLDRRQTLRLIVLPQALRMMLPSFVNQWITLIKDSSLAYVVGVAEFTFVATQVNNREQVYPLEIFAFIALAYFVVCGGLQLLGRWSDRRWSLPARA
ncbi:amino acid ABC transporter permease [Chromobacterium haemolyticum]|uniref:amino acid ABC transporter permease n=1 Tax=Chromobacterium haemolyticum TaxID=394935 RepID=UPI0029544671|nr:ABC transporter permease subunit [Chromobacterium haemolyticum]WON83212.1 ABC transporter permease subunit [Chromobacterium haemolyticum]